MPKEPKPREAKGRWLGAEVGSLAASSDKKTRQLITAGRAKARGDAKSMEAWASSGFDSGIQPDAPLYFPDKPGDHQAEEEEKP